MIEQLEFVVFLTVRWRTVEPIVVCPEVNRTSFAGYLNAHRYTQEHCTLGCVCHVLSAVPER